MDDGNFAQLLEAAMGDLNLPAEARERVRTMPKEQQMDMVRKHHASLQSTEDTERTPQSYIDEIKFSMENVAKRKKILHELAISLRTKTMRFVLLFIEAKGLTFLLERLAQMDYRTRQSEEHLNTVKCISSLMNNTHGLKCVISHPDSMTIIAQSLHTTDIPTKIRVLEILGGVCLIPEGHRKVLHALSHFCRFA
eukprot:gene27912-14420_t